MSEIFNPKTNSLDTKDLHRRLKAAIAAVFEQAGTLEAIRGATVTAMEIQVGLPGLPYREVAFWTPTGYGEPDARIRLASIEKVVDA
jgi:hypothetical protein